MMKAYVSLLLICGARLSLSCDVGSRSDCNDHGVCKANKFFHDDPFFNTCDCDLCWSGSGSCDTNLCLFFGIPVGIFLVITCCCICCGACPCCCAGVGAARVARQARQLDVSIRARFLPQQRTPFAQPTSAGVAPIQPALRPNVAQPAVFVPSAPPPLAPTTENHCLAPEGSELASQVFLVRVPDGVLPGQSVRTVAPSGVSVDVVVPDGVCPGQTFQARVAQSVR
eukprot:TRINITY_DN14540_c0_g1_i3.p1 TRINITY_DN14540_c0_g1~~TRINITY_DN14540_c0_g1_i3.p1  ORF type:complete len:226 (+),score=25.86 TRINITY_DN14540_c0_g1_i3:61-738(+)